jgi:hypothetical protein
LFATTITVYLPLPEHVTVIKDRLIHMRLRAYVLDLQAYNVGWAVGTCFLDPVGGLVDWEAVATLPPTHEGHIPSVQHADVTLNYGATTRRRLPELEGDDLWLLCFDGGAAKGLGTGGFVVYDPSAALVTA